MFVIYAPFVTYTLLPMQTRFIIRFLWTSDTAGISGTRTEVVYICHERKHLVLEKKSYINIVSGLKQGYGLSFAWDTGNILNSDHVFIKLTHQQSIERYFIWHKLS